MAKKIVYSTNPNWSEENQNKEIDPILKNEQVLRVRLETKQRGGKKATVIIGFKGSDVELSELAKTLKVKLGTGGSAKDGEIIIQGDYVQKSKDLLITMGYKNTK